jgi:hypothetical protein
MALNEITITEDLTNDEILARIEEMMSCIESKELRKLKRTDVGNYRDELEKRFPHLAGRYPQIFSMVMMYERTFDMQKMRWMLQMLDKRKSGEVSEQDADNAVSFRQFDEHVRDKIDYEKEREGIEKAKRGETSVKDQPNFKTNMDMDESQ